MDDHDRLIAAIDARDGDRAADVMAVHLDRVRDQMVAALAEDDALTDDPIGSASSVGSAGSVGGPSGNGHAR